MFPSMLIRMIREYNQGGAFMNYTIEGGDLPVAICQLNPGEVMVSENGGRTWSRGNVEVETKGGSAGSMFGRMLSGESLFLSYYTAVGPCEIAFASSFPGSILVKQLQPGESLICQKRAFMAATAGVMLETYVNANLKKGLFGGEGFIMQKITGPGLVFLEIDGYAKEYTLQPGEELVCDTGVLAVMDATCTMDARMVKGIKNKLLGGEGFFDTVITGPGKVHLQTMSLSSFASILKPFVGGK